MTQICDFGLARLRDMSASYAMTANVGTTQVIVMLHSWSLMNCSGLHLKCWLEKSIQNLLIFIVSPLYVLLQIIFSSSQVTWEMLTGKCPYEPLSNQMEV